MDRRASPEVIEVRKAGASESADRSKPVPWGWAVSINPHDKSQHIIPTWDIKQHWLDDKCACQPELDAYEQMSHNSFDGRERYERGAPLN